MVKEETMMPLQCYSLGSCIIFLAEVNSMSGAVSKRVTLMMSRVIVSVPAGPHQRQEAH